MSPVTQQLLASALSLPESERLELIEQIWNSLPQQVNPSEVPAWHLAELAKRRAEADERPGEGRPWRDVLGQVEAES